MDQDLPSDSDLSDQDYIPESGDADPPSEVESDGDPEDETEATPNSRKRKVKARKKSAKKLKSDKPEKDPEEDIKPKEMNQEERKKHEDSLWADFLETTNTKPKANGSSPKSSKCDEKPSKKVQETVAVTKVFEFAGEEVKVTKEVPIDSAEARLASITSPPSGSSKKIEIPKGVPPKPSGLKGISAVLNTLGKKTKISTLEKSKLDWDRFKQDEGIQDDLEMHNKGRDGYLERQDFLNRTDLRQFEIEKQLRSTRRSSR